jgi:hypothetical protein
LVHLGVCGFLLGVLGPLFGGWGGRALTKLMSTKTRAKPGYPASTI